MRCVNKFFLFSAMKWSLSSESMLKKNFEFFFNWFFFLGFFGGFFLRVFCFFSSFGFGLWPVPRSRKRIVESALSKKCGLKTRAVQNQRGPKRALRANLALRPAAPSDEAPPHRTDSDHAEC